MIEKLKDGPKTTEELVVLSGFSKEQVRERMRRAQVEGLVVMNQQGKTFFYWDKEQWNHVNAKKQDKGPITFGELRRISHYIRSNFRIRVYDCVPKRGEETAGVIHTTRSAQIPRQHMIMGSQLSPIPRRVPDKISMAI